MKTQLLNMAYLSGAFLALFGTAELLYHFAKIKGEWTRKLVHVGTGLLTLLFPLMLDNHWQVLFLCVSFAGILGLSLRFDFLKSINDIDRKSHGSLAFPVAVYACYLAYQYFGENYAYFYLPILILAICDPLAALVGKRFSYGKYQIGQSKKTLMGSATFFLSAMLIGTVAFYFNENMTSMELLVFGSLLAAMTTLAEGFSGRGLDNVTIPLATIASLLLIDKMRVVTEAIAFI